MAEAKKTAAKTKTGKDADSFAGRARSLADHAQEFVGDTQDGLEELTKEHAATLQESVPEPGQEKIHAAHNRVAGVFGDVARAVEALEAAAAELGDLTVAEEG